MSYPSYAVLDGAGNLKNVLCVGMGTSDNLIRLVSLAYERAMVDVGVIFSHADRHTIANNTIFNYLLKTPASPAHVELLGLSFIASSTPINVSIYEDTIVSANGTAETLWNNNRNLSTNTPGSLLYLSPTVTSVGTELILTACPGAKSTAGSYRQDDRIILKASANYLFRFENVSGAAADVAIKLIIGED